MNKWYFNTIMKLKRQITNKAKNNNSEEINKLRICQRKGRFYYYIRKNKSDKYGTYIKKKDLKVVKDIVQQEYNENLLENIEEDLELINEVEARIKNPAWIRAIEDMHKGKQVLVDMPVCSDDEYVTKWLAQEYEKLPSRENTKTYDSEKGDIVKSKSELIIANALYAAGIPYLYEKPLKLGKFLTIHPDFTILNVNTREEIYWEHFGIMDDSEYRNNTFIKIKEYEENGYMTGIRLLMTFETYRQQIDINDVKRKIGYLKKILRI